MNVHAPMWALAAVVLTTPVLAQERDIEAGKTVYSRACESCHGPGGRGGQAPAVVPYASELKELTAIVRQGIGLMPAMTRSEITDPEIAYVYAYLKSIPGKDAGPK